jgi:putative transposase
MVRARDRDWTVGVSPASSPREQGGQDARGPKLYGAGRHRTAGVPRALAEAANDGVVLRTRGYLPHVDAPDLVQHIVFRLADSLPARVRADIAKLRGEDRPVAIDAALDAGHGGRELTRPDLAGLIQTALLAFNGERYTLIAWCVMPNHVHALAAIKPGYTLGRIIHSWKSYTSKKANQILGRSGPLWAPEYFERFMRDDDHCAKIAAYIEGNPVKAGLCRNIDEWPFSSAWQGWGGQDARGPNLKRAHRYRTAGVSPASSALRSDEQDAQGSDRHSPSAE